MARGGLVTVALTQHARRPSCPGEIYFLGRILKPTPGLELHLGPDGLALALVGGVRSAFRLGEETRFAKKRRETRWKSYAMNSKVGRW